MGNYAHTSRSRESEQSLEEEYAEARRLVREKEMEIETLREEREKLKRSIKIVPEGK